MSLTQKHIDIQELKKSRTFFDSFDSFDSNIFEEEAKDEELSRRGQFHMEEGFGIVKIEIIDTGIGISIENQNKLFTEFTQVAKDTSK